MSSSSSSKTGSSALAFDFDFDFDFAAFFASRFAGVVSSSSSSFEYA